MMSAQALVYRLIDQLIVMQAALPTYTADYADCFHEKCFGVKKCTITGIGMLNFEFDMAISAPQTRAIYEGRARFILVESQQGLKLRLPAANFRAYVSADGITGRFSVEVDLDNKILALRKL